MRIRSRRQRRYREAPWLLPLPSFLNGPRKRRSHAALHDAGANSEGPSPIRQVLECGAAAPLSERNWTNPKPPPFGRTRPHSGTAVPHSTTLARVRKGPPPSARFWSAARQRRCQHAGATEAGQRSGFVFGLLQIQNPELGPRWAFIADLPRLRGVDTAGTPLCGRSPRRFR
jgi:hypothetical protein